MDNDEKILEDNDFDGVIDFADLDDENITDEASEPMEIADDSEFSDGEGYAIEISDNEEESEEQSEELSDEAEENYGVKDDFDIVLPLSQKPSVTEKSDCAIKIEKIYVINTIVSAVTLCAVAVGIFSGYNYINSLEKNLELKDSAISSLEAEVDRLKESSDEVFNEGDFTAENSSLIDIESGKIMLYDSSVGYTWAPILSGVSLNSYESGNFSLDNRNHMEYTVDGDAKSYFGIDVSSHQGDIDWSAVRSDGVEFAFIRIGYRGYGEEGNMREDTYFTANYDGAESVGIDTGVYFFSQAVSVEEAIEEADYVIGLLDGRNLQLPIVFDWENADVIDENDTARTEYVMPHTLTMCAIAFCERISEAGYTPMIYTSKNLSVLKYDLRMLSDYPKWLAYYDTKPDYPYDFEVWQYGKGYIDGIEGEVDFNIMFM